MKTLLSAVIISCIVSAELFLSAEKLEQNEVHSDLRDLQEEKVDDRPNVIFILVDDVGWADFNYNVHGKSPIPTPNIDRLAQQG